MQGSSRREFLADVGRGMLVASLGAAAAIELGLAPALGDESPTRLTFGELEPLVSLLQETPPDKLLPIVVQKLAAGTDLKTLVTGAALANVRAFGGQDYTGYHTFMALVPAYQMTRELPTQRQALPVLKVLYRNSSRIHEQSAHDHDVLVPVEATETVPAERSGELLREAVRATDWQQAEGRFATVAARSHDEAFNALQTAVQDEVDVHRVVLSWRAWEMLRLSDEAFAHALLRQSVRYCLHTEQAIRDRKGKTSEVRDVLPRLLDQYRLENGPLGERRADDEEVERLARTVFSASRADAAEAVAAALAERMHPEDVAEAMSLAANLLVLHDPGRLPKYSSPQKPPGCVHGDSVGVHASDAANAWRNIQRVSNPRNQVASLIVGAFHTAGQMNWVREEPFPYAAGLEDVRADGGEQLLGLAEEAIRANDQARACAVVDTYGQRQLPTRPLLDLLLKYAVSEDGALHAEKYYRTVSEEFARTRPAFRWRQLVALARVTASEYGFPAPGYQQACELLGVS
ncbi:MAG: hypothetical protein J5I93_17425 [Pirellulaceae bacterium]|nr:hypothetical protein [Pirellulaceae bacterium]